MSEVTKGKKNNKIFGFIKRKKKTTIALGIIVVIGIFIGITVSQGKEAMSLVSTDKVLRENVEYHVKVSGVSSAVNAQHILAKATGTVANIYVKQGDSVTAGQSLAQIESPDLDKQIEEARVRVNMESTRLSQSQQSLGSAKSNLPALESSYNIAKKTYEGNVALFNEGALSQIALDASKLDMDRAYTQYQQAQKDSSNGSAAQGVSLQSNNLTIAKLAYSALLEQKQNLIIKSPINGVIAESNLNIGAATTMGFDAFYIIDNSKIVIKANVGEYDAQRIKEGFPAKVTLEGSDGKTYDAKVSFVSPYAKKSLTSQNAQTIVEIAATVENGDESLKAGYTVTLDILCAHKENALTVPYESIFTSKEGQKYIFTSDKEIVTAYKIKTGIEGSLRIEITDTEIKEGADILLNPTEETMKQAGLGEDEKSTGEKND